MDLIKSYQDIFYLKDATSKGITIGYQINLNFECNKILITASSNEDVGIKYSLTIDNEFVNSSGELKNLFSNFDFLFNFLKSALERKKFSFSFSLENTTLNIEINDFITNEEGSSIPINLSFHLKKIEFDLDYKYILGLFKNEKEKNYGLEKKIEELELKNIKQEKKIQELINEKESNLSNILDAELAEPIPNFEKVKIYIKSNNFTITDDDMRNLFKNFKSLNDGINIELKQAIECDDDSMYYGEWDVEQNVRHGIGVQLRTDESNTKAIGKMINQI